VTRRAAEQHQRAQRGIVIVSIERFRQAQHLRQFVLHVRLSPFPGKFALHQELSDSARPRAVTLAYQQRYSSVVTAR
jgi:hypothetical protein